MERLRHVVALFFQFHAIFKNSTKLYIVENII